MNAVDVIVILLLGLILFFFFSFGQPLWKQIFGIINNKNQNPPQTFSTQEFLQSPRIYSTPQWNTPPPSFASFQLPWTRNPKTPPQTSVNSAPQFTERKTKTPSGDQIFNIPPSQAHKDPTTLKSGATPGEAIGLDQTDLFPPQPMMNDWTPSSAMDASETKTSSSRKRYITQDENTDEAKKLKPQSAKDERLSKTKRKVPKDTEDSTSTKHVKLSMDDPKKRKLPMLLLVLSVYPTSSQFLEEQKIPETKIEEEEDDEEVIEHGKDEVTTAPHEEPEEDIQTQEFLTPKSLSFSSPFKMEIKTTPSKTRSGRVRIPSKKKPQGTPMKSLPEDDENEENRILAILKSASEKDGGK